MGRILSYYTKYLKEVPDYKKWNEKVSAAQNSPVKSDETLKNKARLLAEPMLLSDKYEHERMEDSETFYQTFNIELMSLATLVATLPSVIPNGVLSHLEKISDKSNFQQNLSNVLKKYSSSPAKKMLGVAVFAAAAALFAGGIKHSMESQLGIIRKASFDASNQILDDPKIFADIDSSQQEQLSSIISSEAKTNSDIVNKLKDKVDINSSLKAVKNYNSSKNEYLKSKSKYFEELRNEDLHKTTIAASEKESAAQNKKLLENYFINVEHGVLETLRRVETISNISYSAIFTGGFLEYLITDKLVDVLKIKNKPLQIACKIGVPLLTYLLLNKNISDIENKAILATKYKYVKKFMENPEGSETPDKEKKQPLFEFIKTVASDMKEYSKFSEKELPQIEQKLQAKKELKLSKEQETDAKRMQKGVTRLLNSQREHLYNQTVGIKTFSETILGPIDIASTAIGAFIGSALSKKLPNVPKNLLKGLGAVAAFIPAAIIEAKLTTQQKLAEKSAVMMALNDNSETKNFALNIKPDKDENYTSNILLRRMKELKGN
ncbi:hypothetical protein II906_12540 [bacterium]|nr:hypothetical protein [bacterium]